MYPYDQIEGDKDIPQIIGDGITQLWKIFF
jgi:hypothetical protein